MLFFLNENVCVLHDNIRMTINLLKFQYECKIGKTLSSSKVTMETYFISKKCD